MSRPQESVEKAIKNFIPRGIRLLVAVSGGIDSMVLLYGLYNLRRLLKINLLVAHVDHGLRDESKRDRQFVEKCCAELGLQCFTFVPDLPESGENLEAWGRKVRYGFFKQLCEQHSIDFTVTAHNANDVAETLLMRLVANKELRSLELIDERRKLIRPLLSVSRQEIEDYARKHSIDWVEDNTNKDDSFLRNKIRNNLIPYLEENFDGRIVEVLSQRARGLHNDYKGIKALLKNNLDRVKRFDVYSARWVSQLKIELEELPSEVHWFLIEQLLRDELGFGLSRHSCEQFCRFIRQEITAFELPGAIRLRYNPAGFIEKV
ncbi:MAG: tRNA lysidine(34) synthetase TilS [Candidatus Dadabacteria bacterium]|nr:MAG: tRNA lysidine(34) synthetase TilS [Candidatus Dadabacteria bacterium]